MVAIDLEALQKVLVVMFGCLLAGSLFWVIFDGGGSPYPGAFVIGKLLISVGLVAFLILSLVLLMGNFLSASLFHFTWFLMLIGTILYVSSRPPPPGKENPFTPGPPIA